MMPYDSGDAASSKVLAFKAEIGSVTTLDEAPPSFTRLQLEDPTANDDRIVVTFELNEAGTAYCRATRADSGETAQEMGVNRILSAAWSAAYVADGGTVTIEMTKLENVDPSVTNRDDEDVPMVQATLYDVYCWAQDDAESTKGFARPNYMTHDYVSQAVEDEAAPSGGMQRKVWVTDATPPTMILVGSESMAEDTIQVTLQLSEPGTLWCQIMSLEGPNPAYCTTHNLQDSNTNVAQCHYERFIKGNEDAGVATVYRADIHEAYRDYDISLSKLYASSEETAAALVPETDYQVYCFAEDDWAIEADSVPLIARSPSYATPASPNKVTLAAVDTLRTAIGTKTTLDEAPPSFTSLTIQDPTEFNDKIIVTFALNEAGTAYCRATRGDSGETKVDMPIVCGTAIIAIIVVVLAIIASIAITQLL